jgi:phosphoesterase RecJ-like protein
VCLFTGIVADTGWFRYSNTNVQTLSVASNLLSMGIPVAALSERLYLSRSKPAVKLVAWALSNMKLLLDDKVAVMAIPEKIIESLGATSDDMEELVNQGLQMGSVCASVLLREHTRPPQIKVSLRSKGEYDINQIARTFGGGGHKNASGCKIADTLENATKAVEKELPRIFVHGA